MRPIDQPPGLCSIDPITLGAIALGTLVGGAGTAIATGAFGGGGGGESTPPPAQPQAAPAPTRPAAAPASNPVGSATANQNRTPTFVGANAAPENRSFGSRTLLGQ